MADQFTEVTSKSWLQNITDSFAGVLVGVILFFLAFYVLWVNEGNVDMAKIALNSSIAIKADTLNSDADGKFVSLTGSLVADAPIGDTGYLRPGSYVKLDRQVEMYAWIEKTKSETKDKLGGGSETTTTYTYYKNWTANPPASADFKHPEDHQNPAMAIESASNTAPAAKIGVYKVDVTEMDLPKGGAVAVGSDNVVSGKGRPEAGYIYIGSGSIPAPQLGDLRISYRALPSGIKVTAFGKLDGSELTPYYYQNKTRFFRAIKGTREEAVFLMAEERKTTMWVMRVVGFAMMWLGLTLFFGPLNEILDVLPFLGKASRFLIGLVSFPVALVLSIITILISMVAHNIWLLIAVLVIIAGLISYKKFAGQKAK
jgi:hypothetical protein